MCPKEDQFRVKGRQAEAVRRKRKELQYGPYNCPKCGMNRLMIQVNKETKEAKGTCVCGLGHPLRYVEAYERVDYYNKLIDEFYRKRV